MADINFNTVTVASAIDDSDYLHITTGGSHRRVLTSTLIAKAKSDTLTTVDAAMLDKLTDGCFVMYHNRANGLPQCATASAWTQLQSNGEVANGVLVISGDRNLVVAPTRSALMHWGSSSTLVASSGGYSNDLTWAMKHFDGKARTAAIVSNSAYSGDGTGYAPGYANAYSRSNTNGKGLTAGKWWLPSAGEMAMMLANKNKINACLALITGSALFTAGQHWTSSEMSLTSAWGIYIDRFLITEFSKVNSDAYVRPVSEFRS